MLEIKNIQDYKEIIAGEKPVLLDFYADWCGPCKVLLPIVEELANENADNFTIAKVNVDKNPELARQFRVRSIPSLFFLQNGEVQENLVGLASKAALQNKIDEFSLTV